MVLCVIAFRNYILSLSARSKRQFNYITRALVQPFAKISPMLSGPNVLVLKTFIFSLQNTFNFKLQVFIGASLFLKSVI